MHEGWQPVGRDSAATPEDVSRVVQRCLHLLDESFPGRTVGFYLYRSVCRGDYLPGWSDVDHLLILEGTASAPMTEKIAAIYAQVSGEFPDGEYLGYVLPGRRKDGFCFQNGLAPAAFESPCCSKICHLWLAAFAACLGAYTAAGGRSRKTS